MHNHLSGSLTAGSVVALPAKAVKAFFNSTVWPALVSQCRTKVLDLLEHAQHGELEIHEHGQRHRFGEVSKKYPKTVQIQVRSDTFWVRLVLRADLGFAESYLKHEIDVNDLPEFFKFFINNRDELDNVQFPHSIVMDTFNVIINSRLANTVANAINNISAHYDIGNEIFECFLDPTMTYSSAIWRNPEDTLETAQRRKLTMMIEKACITERDHVLEIGSGWGSLSILAVQTTGCRVTTLTLSCEQKEFAEARIAHLGLADRITVMLCDYRDLDPAQYQFDKIVSIEMIEAVGFEYMDTYFRCCHRLLHPDHGIFVLQGITMPESRFDQYQKSVDFIRKYIFPGGQCPTVTSIVTAADRGSNGQLILNHMENFPTDYARTLKEWREMFLRNYDAVAKAISKKAEGPVYDKLFKRKWEYYLAYCEGGYATRTLGLVQMVFVREADQTLVNRQIGY
ncbi:hypothetical protein H4R35_006666 [Dimargaris xerosporica]|nr:hypothetical protein H4R35_006666 [Dimargaris xerosporica]